MPRVPRRRRVAAALALVVAATRAACSSAHPVDPFHELVDDPATTVVRGPGSVKKHAEASSGSGAAAAVAAAVDSWHVDTRTTRLADVAPAREASHGREEDGGNADDAIEAIVSSAAKRNAASPPCAPCDGCSVDWAAASRAVSLGEACRGHGACGGCEVDLRRINGTYGLKRLGDGVEVKRETGASAATVLRAVGVFSATELDAAGPSGGERAMRLAASASGIPGGHNVSLDNATSTSPGNVTTPWNVPASPFVKFVCIPGLPRHGTNCTPGVPTKAETRLVTNTESLQRLSDFCGLESISTRSWVARVVGTAPAGLPLDPWSNHPDAVPVNQTGIFSSPARGVALSALCSKPALAPAVLRAIPSHEIAKAAVFDFLFCAGDRHTQNVYVSDDASVTLIDNDNLLGEQVFKPESKFERACAVSSLFLPGTMESWRLRRSKYCGGALGTLDYRCHVGPSGELALPEKLRRCLRTLADDDAETTRATFGMLERVYAETLKKRAGDLLSEGLTEALRRAGLAEKAISDAAAGERPVGKLWEELDEDGKAKMMAWRDSMWRPTEPAVCHGLVPNWEGAPHDWRRDARFEGGNATCDETGAQIQSTTERK
jgi:hypothetical protein